MAEKPSEETALRQSPSEGHSPKGLWVAKAIAGGELFVSWPIKEMKMDYRFLQANIGELIGLIVLILSYTFHIDQFVSFGTIIILTVVSFYVYGIAFEYQRITLTIARCVKIKIGVRGNIDIVEIQELLSATVVGFILLSADIVFGIIAGYLLRIGIVYLVIVLFVKYIGLVWIPVPTPFKLFFRLIDKELIRAGSILMFSERMETFLILTSIYKEMPHDKTYEDWAFKEYGTTLLEQK